MYRSMSKGLLLGLCGALFWVGFAHAAQLDSVLKGSTCTAPHYGSFDCTKTIDGDPTTAWTNAAPQGDVVIYTATSTVNAWSMIFGGPVNAMYASQNASTTLEGSNDNATWTLLDTMVATSTDINMGLNYFNNSTQYRYYRITEKNGTYNIGFDEVDLYAIPNGSTTTNSTSTATTTPDTPTAQVGFLVLSMLIFGTGIFLAMWIF